MELSLLEEAAELVEKANADLSPELCSRADARALLVSYARIERLVAFGKAALADRLGDAAELARTGTSMGRARQTIETSRRLQETPRLSEALRRAEVSLDQAEEIAKTETLCPGSAEHLLALARTQAFHVLKDRARTLRLQAQAGPGLADRQHQARFLRHRVGGMIQIKAQLEPHMGTSIVNRLETEAGRLARSARRRGDGEPFERYLADALPALLAGKGGGATRRPELVVLVSHEIAKKGWRHVGKDETCKIPSVGPIAPEVAKEIARDAFLTGVFYDGKDLRHFKRWTRNIPVEVRIALELGEPPDFDGVRCVDCGNRFRIEFDHVEPHAAGGTASVDNMGPRCSPCHDAKTKADRESGKLRPRRDDRAPP